MIGMTLAIVILLFILNQFSYDTFHRNHSRIYRLTTTGQNNFEGKHFAKVFDPVFVPPMAKYFPEIEIFTRLVPVLGGVVKSHDRFIKIEQGYQCDSTFFKVFDCQFLIGSPEVFNKPGSMVVTESFAKKAFGNTDVIGQLITIPEGQYYGASSDFVVNGLIKDFPQNSHVHPEFVATPSDRNELDRVAWTYLLLYPNSNPAAITRGFRKFYLDHVNKDTANIQKAYLQNISDIHLHSDKLREIEPNGSITFIYTLAVSGTLLLLISIINFVNLASGMAAFSMKFLHVSKIFGSTRFVAARYFLGESALIVGVSSIITLIALAVSDQVIVRNFSMYLLDKHWLLIVIVTALIGMTIIFLTTVISINRVTNGLSSSRASQKKDKSVTNALIVFQNLASVCMIIAVIVIHQQTEYALSSSLGAKNQNLICLDNVHSEVQQKFETFKVELLKLSSIKSVSAMLDKPGEEANDMMPFTLEGYRPNGVGGKQELIGVQPCDYSLSRTFDLTFLGGRDFSDTNDDKEGVGEYIINESALRHLNYTQPDAILGREFQISFDASIPIPKGRIIGVVKDFHLSTLRKKIEPLVLFKRKNLWLLNIAVAFNNEAKKQGLVDVEHVWKSMFPSHNFQYQYVASMYQNVYKTENLQMNLLSIFTLMALFVSGMGLLGLCLLNVQRRLKELAIRKVNGAQESQLLSMISWQFIKWVLLACFLAFPLSYYLMNEWLAVFVYRIDISWWVYVFAGFIAILVSFFTIFFQALKAARSNPAAILKYE